MPEKIAVFLNRQRLGTLLLHGEQDLYDLQYDPEWIAGGGYAISPHLPTDQRRSDAVRRFLSNLLPEEERLEDLSRETQISKGNVFGLVAAIGDDTVGALTFRYSGLGEAKFREIGIKELSERIANRDHIPIAKWDGKLRLSVAGVQDKLPVVIMPDGRMGLGEGDLASTHLLKFGRKTEINLVVNEFFCMRLAELCGLNVAQTDLLRHGEPVLLVKRFDRSWLNNRVERIHQIDGCQMLDLPPSYKYERPFGPGRDVAHLRTGSSLPRLFGAVRNHCRMPAKAIKDVLQWCLFGLLIENSDAHGKNISFFVDKKGISPTPAYDLLNVGIYGQAFDQTLAMAVGDEFEPEQVRAFDIAEMCVECDLPLRRTAIVLKNLCTTVLKKIDEIPVDYFEKQEKDFVHGLSERIKRNAWRFIDIADELPHVQIDDGTAPR